MKQVKQHKVNSLYVTFKPFTRWVRAEKLQPKVIRPLVGCNPAASWLTGLALLFVGSISAYASVLNTVTAVGDNTPPVSVSICTAQVPGAVAVMNSASIMADNAPDNASNVCVDVFNTFDFGDAPDDGGANNYGTLSANNGASHVIIPDLFIGAGVDNEADGAPNTNADGDIDSDGQVVGGNVIPDGVVLTSPGGASNAEINAQVTVTNDTASAAAICGWLDRWTDGGAGQAALDGVFDDDTDAANNGECQAVPIGGGTFTFSWTGLPDVSGVTYARFRLCQTQSNCESPLGTAPSGEVEDFRVPFTFIPTEATIGNVSLTSLSIEDLFAQLQAEGLGRDQLLDLLASFDPALAASLAGADISSILEALRQLLDPDGDGNVALFQWETLAQINTLGFYVEREDADGNWIRIADKMLPAMIAPIGAEYLLLDPSATSGTTYRYRMIERETTGGTRTYGPFTLRLP